MPNTVEIVQLYLSCTRALYSALLFAVNRPQKRLTPGCCALQSLSRCLVHALSSVSPPPSHTLLDQLENTSLLPISLHTQNAASFTCSMWGDDLHKYINGSLHSYWSFPPVQYHGASVSCVILCSVCGEGAEGDQKAACVLTYRGGDSLS